LSFSPDTWNSIQIDQVSFFHWIVFGCTSITTSCFEQCWNFLIMLLVFDSWKLWALEDRLMDTVTKMIIITNCSFQFCCWNKIWEDDETIPSIQCSFEVQKLHNVLFVFDWSFIVVAVALATIGMESLLWLCRHRQVNYWISGFC